MVRCYRCGVCRWLSGEVQSLFFDPSVSVGVTWRKHQLKTVLVWVRPATKAPRSRPSPRWGAEENGKKQAETGGSG